MVNEVSVPALRVMVAYCGVATTTSDDDTFRCGLGVSSSSSDSVLWYSLCNVICLVECVCLC